MIINRFAAAMDTARAYERRGGDPLEALARMLLMASWSQEIRDGAEIDRAMREVPSILMRWAPDMRGFGVVESRRVDMVPRLTTRPDPQRWASGLVLGLPGEILSSESRNDVLYVVTALGLFEIRGSVATLYRRRVRLKWAWLRGYYGVCAWLARRCDPPSGPASD